MQQSRSFPLAALTFFSMVISLPSAALDRYSTLEKSRMIFVRPLFVDEAEKLISDDLYVVLVKNFLIDELCDVDVADFFDVEPPGAATHRRLPMPWILRV